MERETDMVTCPYNKAHRMLRKRLQPHLIRCRLSYPGVELRKCPINQLHLITEREYSHHLATCPDRKLITLYKYDMSRQFDDKDNVQVTPIKQKPIECDEDWDDTDVGSYDPSTSAASSHVIRQPIGIQPSQRKIFREEELKRLRKLECDECN